MNDKNRFYALVTAREGFLYEKPDTIPASALDKSSCISYDAVKNEISDTLLSGWAVELLEEQQSAHAEEDPANSASAWAYIRTFYGYEGWIRQIDLCRIRKDELLERQDKSRFMRIGARSADILPVPKVQGVVLETLLQDSIVEVLESPAGREEWSLVRSASGIVGWVFAAALSRRCDNDGFLLQDDSDFFLKQAQLVKQEAGEEALRRRVVQSACSYLGCTYRWGGKSPLGIDCSGLVFMSWMEQGILIYRDAHLQDGFPVREINKSEMKKGDLLFFPGHVAMYLEDDRFIHATGALASPCVRMNSLCASSADYREDLAKNITMCGSIF